MFSTLGKVVAGRATDVGTLNYLLLKVGCCFNQRGKTRVCFQLSRRVVLLIGIQT